MAILIGFEPLTMKIDTLRLFVKVKEFFWIDSIKFNAAKRGLTKLCLKSMWGILCENPRKTQTKLICDPQELYRFLATPGIEVRNLLFAGDSVVWLAWPHAEESRM